MKQKCGKPSNATVERGDRCQGSTFLLLGKIKPVGL
jgi:hypothetical protein